MLQNETLSGRVILLDLLGAFIIISNDKNLKKNYLENFTKANITVLYKILYTLRSLGMVEIQI